MPPPPGRRSPLAQAIAAVEAVLAEHPEVGARRLSDTLWLLVLSGEIRPAIPVTVRLGERTALVTSFLLRGPHGDCAALHRVLLRKNAATTRVRFALDGDDDVILVARLSTAALTAEELEAVLGEIMVVSESSFEPLVHLGYPGVFPPLARRPWPAPQTPER